MVSKNKRVFTISDTNSGEFTSLVFINKTKPDQSFVIKVDVMDIDFISLLELEIRLKGQFSGGNLKVTGSYYTDEINPELSLADIQIYSPFYFELVKKIRVSVDPSLKISEFWLETAPGLTHKTLFEQVSSKTKLTPQSFYLTLFKDDKPIIISRNSNLEILANHLDGSSLVVSKLIFDKPLVSLKLLADKSFELQISLENTVRELVELIDMKEKLFSSTIRLVYENEALEKGSKTLKNAGIKDKSTIRLVGGTDAKDAPSNESLGIKFVDVGNTSGLEKIKWSKTAPRWRTAAHGLNIEGKCTNQSCEAKNQMVIVNKGIGEVYDLENHKKTNKCPVCSQQVEAVLCAFNNCLVKFAGQKYVGEKLVTVKTQKELEFGDVYNRFNPDKDKSGTAEWKFLKIFTSKLPIDEKDKGKCECPFCKGRISEKSLMLKCGHYYHSGCITYSQDLETTQTTDCVLCTDRSTLTEI